MKLYTYKNGKTGKRYKGYSIYKTDDSFEVISPSGEVLIPDIEDIMEAEWEIEKDIAKNNGKLEELKAWYNAPIYKLDELFVKYNDTDKEIAKLLNTIKYRKVKNTPY